MFQHVVKVLYADRAYDRHKLYKLCKEYNIKAKILPKTCAAEHLKIDCMSDRNTAIRLIKLHNVRWYEEVERKSKLWKEVIY
ncbi:hypothetical protein LEM02_01095 [Wolbachia endosymbiont of Tribolium confusum]|uniref:hypothetical protein n=1 Tax=Wolbachia endosymbiont of Tribolium confusum TaxID=214474 RepID=UPI001CF591FE|nr:hypothetical protein [Wolbachia endosymbiont of Tribolium confusum]MCA7009985.1 hypothetical protein [Wolbachia endosymbiont of Tribolium confusum]